VVAVRGESVLGHGRAFTGGGGRPAQLCHHEPAAVVVQHWLVRMTHRPWSGPRGLRAIRHTAGYQYTSRDGDMQLHQHNQIAHVAITRHDGKGLAPDSTAYYEHVRAAGQIASVHAEAALTRRLGMTWVPRPDGMRYGIDGIGANLMGVFSHRRSEITKLTAQELVPRFKAERGRPPNQRELAGLQEQAALRTRGQRRRDRMGRGIPLEHGGCAPCDAGTELTRDEITRSGCRGCGCDARSVR